METGKLGWWKANKRQAQEIHLERTEPNRTEQRSTSAISRSRFLSLSLYLSSLIYRSAFSPILLSLSLCLHHLASLRFLSGPARRRATRGGGSPERNWSGVRKAVDFLVPDREAAAGRMKEEEPNWFSRWEDELPPQEELTPLSQTLITPDLALAFGIGMGISPPSPPGHVPNGVALYSLDCQLSDPLPPSRAQSQSPMLEYEPPDLGSGGAGAGGGGGNGAAGGADDQARTLKRPRLVWTPQLHKRFVDAVAHLGIKNAVPKTIMQLMSVDGLTRENVASHLQKYRLYLKRMQGLSGGGGGVGGGAAAADPATEHLFASGPVPQQFLSRGTAGGAADQFAPFVPIHHQQLAGTAALHHQQQQQFYHRHVGQLGSSPPSVGGFDHGFLGRQPQPGIHRVVGPAPGAGGVVSPASICAFGKDFDAGSGGRKELSLFPTKDD